MLLILFCMYHYKDENRNFNYIEFKPQSSSSYFIGKEQLLCRKDRHI